MAEWRNGRLASPRSSSTQVGAGSNPVSATMIGVIICWLIERYDFTYLWPNPANRHNVWRVNDREFELGYVYSSDFIVLVEMGRPKVGGQKLINHINIKFADPEMFDKIIEFCES